MPSSTIDASWIRLCVRDAGRLLAFPLVTPLPSACSAALPCDFALFAGFLGTMDVSDFSSASMTGLRHMVLPILPSQGRHRRDLPVSVHETSQRAQGLRPRRVGPGQATYAMPRIAFCIA